MNCPKCGKSLPDTANMTITFCPSCGERLFDVGKKYLVEIQCAGQRSAGGTTMKVVVDDKRLYEIIPGESICILLDAGFHTMYFKYRIREKTIEFLVNSSYVVKAFYNTLSSLIETSIMMVEDSEGGVDLSEIAGRQLTAPIMESLNGIKGFEVILGEEAPDYEIRVATGLKEGILRLYSERCEFISEGNFSKDIIDYRNVAEVKKKMGSIDIVCDGNVHKVYSIPKDTYNEVLAYLTNRISEVRAR